MLASTSLFPSFNAVLELLFWTSDNHSVACAMKPTSRKTLPISGNPTKSLNNVLDQSEQVKDLVEECAEELVSVNTTLKQELVGQSPSAEVAEALEQSVTNERDFPVPN